MVQPFDVRRLALTGEPIPIADQIQTLGGGTTNGVFSASDNGVLAYQTGTGAAASQLAWIDRMGKSLASVGDRGLYADLVLSADGKRRDSFRPTVAGSRTSRMNPDKTRCTSLPSQGRVASGKCPRAAAANRDGGATAKKFSTWLRITR
jgi:hypothetical protein